MRYRAGERQWIRIFPRTVMILFFESIYLSGFAALLRIKIFIGKMGRQMEENSMKMGFLFRKKKKRE